MVFKSGPLQDIMLHLPQSSKDFLDFALNFFRCSITHLIRADDVNPARILSVASDGSMRFFSPVSGNLLQISYPVLEDSNMINIEVDSRRGIFYLTELK